MVMAAIGFSALSLDTGNINQANSASFLSDLHLTTDGKQSSAFHGVFNELISSEIRLQLGEHHLSHFLLVCRIALAADFEAGTSVCCLILVHLVDDIRLDPIDGYPSRYVSGVSHLLTL